MCIYFEISVSSDKIGTVFFLVDGGGEAQLSSITSVYPKNVANVCF